MPSTLDNDEPLEGGNKNSKRIVPSDANPDPSSPLSDTSGPNRKEGRRRIQGRNAAVLAAFCKELRELPLEDLTLIRSVDHHSGKAILIFGFELEGCPIQINLCPKPGFLQPEHLNDPNQFSSYSLRVNNQRIQDSNNYKNKVHDILTTRIKLYRRERYKQLKHELNTMASNFDLERFRVQQAILTGAPIGKIVNFFGIYDRKNGSDAVPLIIAVAPALDIYKGESPSVSLIYQPTDSQLDAELIPSVAEDIALPDKFTKQLKDSHPHIFPMPSPRERIVSLQQLNFGVRDLLAIETDKFPFSIPGRVVHITENDAIVFRPWRPVQYNPAVYFSEFDSDEDQQRKILLVKEKLDAELITIPVERLLDPDFRLRRIHPNQAANLYMHSRSRPDWLEQTLIAIAGMDLRGLDWPPGWC